MRKHLFHVGGKPFFTIGGQTHNSSTHSDEMMERSWIAAEAMGFNTIAAPVCWYQLEPEEGKFDFAAVDRIVNGARSRGLHAVILWFGTWKNGTSHYVPAWVKLQEERFTRVTSASGVPTGILSPICEETRKADLRAFSELMQYLKKVNTDETVIGVQVENEPGQLGSPMDYSAAAMEKFEAQVPADCVEFLAGAPDCPIRKIWEANGAKMVGSWKELFGGLESAEIFSAYYISKYIDTIAAAGKEIYDIPMYINVWLGEMQNRVAGVDFPSGGATSRMIDLWKYNTPHIDAIAPDIYIQDADSYREISKAYAREDNPFYIPESAASLMNALNVNKEITDRDLCGIHVFGIESYVEEDGTLKDRAKEYARAVKIYKAAAPLLEQQESNDSIKVYAVSQFEGSSFGFIDFGDYIGYINYFAPGGGFRPIGVDNLDYFHRDPETYKVRAKGLIFYLGGGEFYITGEGFSVILTKKGDIGTMTAAQIADPALNTRNLRYITLEEGEMDRDGVFHAKRMRCGDESDYGVWTHSDVGLVHVVTG